MKAILPLFCITALSAIPGFAGTQTDVDLQTRCVGLPPTHQTVDSTRKWIENPLEQRLTIAVTNLYADANAYMEIVIGQEHRIFYGAGIDQLGNYIPTNYPPVVVNAVLRREYPMNIMCPNSGPNGSPLFKVGDLSPNNFLPILTSANPDPVSAFLWTNFTAQGQFALTNASSTYEIQQTNLVLEINRILLGPSIYQAQRFAGVTLQPATTNLLAQNPQGQQLVRLNRLLIHDAYASFYLPEGQPDNSGTAEITFSVMPPPEIKIKKNEAAPRYTVVVTPDTRVANVLNLVHPTGGNVSTNISTIEVVQDKFARFGLGDGCDDPSKAAGQGNWLNIGPGCTGETNRIAIDWSVNLGRTFDGLAAGQLAIRERGLSRDTYTSYALYYNASSTNLYAEFDLVPTNMGVSFTNVYAPVILIMTNVPDVLTNSAGQLYTNYDNLIRQVKSCQAFVDVLTPNTNQTVLNFYHSNQVGTNQDATGLYTNITGYPFVTWTIQNPEPATTDKLVITENRNSTASSSSLVKTASGGGVTWTLTLGSGASTRVETRQVSFVGSPATGRIELDTVRYGTSGTPAFQCQETYHFYDWGSELTETRIPNSPDLVTTYDYYTDIGDPGYGQLKSILYPDGYWEKRDYNDDAAANEEWRWWGWGISGYWPGLLRHVYYPYLDGRNGGATNINDANQYNTIYSKFYYGGEGFVNEGGGSSEGWNARRSVKFDGFHGLIPEITTDVNETLHDGNSEGDVMDSIINFQESAEWMWHGTRNGTYSDAAPVGLSGHYTYINYSLSPGQPAGQVFYYDHGVFTNNQFVINSTNHMYAGAVTNYYPDHRETKLVYENLYFEEPSADVFGTIEDHSDLWIPEFLPGYYVFLFPNQTKKQTRIFQGGNLVQTEEYVYAGQQDESNWILLNTVRYYSDSLGRVTNAARIDPVSQQSRIVYSADYRGNTGQDGELLFSETDEFGVAKQYQHDSLKRVSSTTTVGHGAQPDQTLQYVYDANNQPTVQAVTAGFLSQTQMWAYDFSGRLTNHVDESGIAVSTTYSANNQIATSTYPGGATIIHEQYLDRRTKAVYGSKVIPKYYDYDIADGAMIGSPRAIQKATTYTGHYKSPRWRAQGVDQYGLDAWTEWPVGSTTTNTAWEARWNYFFGWPIWINRSQGFPAEKIAYGFSGKTNKVEFLTDKNEDWMPSADIPFWEIDLSVDVNSRVSLTDSAMVQSGGIYYEATTNYACLTDGSADQTVKSIHLEQLNGFQGSEIARTIDYDADLNQTIATTYLDRANNKMTVVATQPATSVLSATNVYQNGSLISASTFSVAAPTVYFYDALGRTNSIQNPLGFSSYETYDPNTGWVTSSTDFAGHTTSYTYFGVTEAHSGKIKCQTDANGKKTYYDYTSHDQLFHTWGDVPYPAEYHYSEYGDLTNLVTFQGGSGWSLSAWPASPGTGDNTYWVYDDASGALLQKIDASGRAITYSYNTTNGLFATRSWSRLAGTNIFSVTVTNLYNDFGDMTGMSYNDGTSSVQFNNFNRAGQAREIIDGSGTNSLTYDQSSRLISVTCNGGVLGGITVSNHFSAAYGRDGLAVSGTVSPLVQTFGYDSYGRLGSVSSGSFSANYGYLPNSDLLQTTTCKSNTATILTTTRAWDYGFRLGAIANYVDGMAVTSHGYEYDLVNRRTRSSLEDGTVWNYDYDDRNELTGAHRNWPDAFSVAGQQFTYNYDNIGNRATASRGGDTNGTNLRTTVYTANSLNEYTSISTPGYRDIIGAALATNSVTVNSGNTDRRWEYFHKEIATANNTGPAWQSVSVTSAGVTTEGGLVLPPQVQTLTYDLDGNLTFDGLWSYQWDGENRLRSMTMTNVDGLANSKRLKLDFVYDSMNRRVQKIISVYNGTTFVAQSTNRFIYDGWNLITILDSQSSALQTFMWGQDLSGTAKAGGVGGLLMVNVSGTNCFTAYDGNGNITALVNTSDKSLAAKYEYSPFGELLRRTGLLARQNPFRFSTKFWDEESGLVYYGGRYYSPSTGKWIGRDPTADQIFLNLYLFCHNNPVGRIDINGCGDYTLTGLACTMGISGTIDGLMAGAINSVFGESFWKGFRAGFAAGAIGGGIAYVGAGLGYSTLGAAIGSGFSTALQDVFQGKKINGIMVGLSMMSSGLVQARWGEQMEEAMTGLSSGLPKGSFVDFLDRIGLSGDEIALDATLSVAASAGVGAADFVNGIFNITQGVVNNANNNNQE